MASSRTRIALALLIVSYGLARGVDLALRSRMVTSLSEGTGDAWSSIAAGSILGPVAIGVLALAVGARVALIGCGVLGVAAVALAGRLDDAPAWAFGAGAAALVGFRCVVTALPALLLRRSWSLRAAYVYAMFLAGDLIGIASPLLMFGLPDAAPAILTLIATVVAGAALVVARADDDDDDEPAPPPMRAGRQVAFAMLLVGLALPGFLALGAFFRAGASAGPIAYAVGSLLGAAASLTLLVACARRASRGEDPPWRLIIDVGAACLFVGALCALVLGDVAGNLAYALLALGDLAMPILLARALAGHTPRWSVLVVAVWMAGPQLVASGAGFAPSAALIVAALAAIAVPLLVRRYAERVRAWVETPPRPDSWLSGR